MSEKRTLVVAGSTGILGQSVVEVVCAEESYQEIVTISRHDCPRVSPEHTHLAIDLCSEFSSELEFLFNSSRVDWIHCVGAFSDYKRLDQHSADEINNLVEGNFTSVANSMSKWLSIVRTCGAGRFIAYSSVTSDLRLPFISLFSATKYALEGLVSNVTSEILDQSISCMCIRLPTVKAPSELALKPNGDYEKWIEPEEVASATLNYLRMENIAFPRGSTIALWHPSTSFNGQSTYERYGVSLSAEED